MFDKKTYAKKYHKEYSNRPEVKKHKAEYMKEYNQRLEVKERKREWNRNYMKEYTRRPKVKESKKEYEKEYSKRPETKIKRKGYMRKYNQKIKSQKPPRKYKTKEEIKTRRRLYDQIRSKKYYKRPEVKKHRNEYFKNKYEIDIGYRITCNLRKRIQAALKGRCKSRKTKELLGCSIEYLLDYLESQFDDEMSWFNRNLWHIDHKLPCKSFDLTNEEEQKKCFNYSNMCPMWAMDNLRKSANYEPGIKIL